MVLFQGDSITDAGRDRGDSENMGHGYAMMVAAWFSALHPERRVRFLNRGIGGNRVRDLKSRWQADCIDLRPTWVSIMIGINDAVRRYDSNDPTPPEGFEADYRCILSGARDRLAAHVILCEPFLLRTLPDRVGWRDDLDPKTEAVRRLTREFDALLVPLDQVFKQACAQREPGFWAADGVHPSAAGHALIAQAWLRTVGAL